MHGHSFGAQGERAQSLAPAYDLNPTTDKDGLALNIDMDNNALDFERAMSVGGYFQLTIQKMKSILEEIKKGVSDWRAVANKIGISRHEQGLMEPAFRW